MPYTKFGELIKEIRNAHGEVMGDLAKVLNVSVPFLSSVENGRKNVPEDWLEIISKHYSLTENEKINLKKAIEESRVQIKVNLQNASLYKRQMAIQFQRSFNKLDDDTVKKIFKLLEEEK